jgi:hypothetical protein
VVKKAENYPPTVWYIFVTWLLIRGRVTFRFRYLRELNGKSGQCHSAMFKKVLHLAYTYIRRPISRTAYKGTEELHVQVTTVALSKLASLKRCAAKNICPLVSRTIIRINRGVEVKRHTFYFGHYVEVSDCVENEEVLHSAKEDKNVLGTVKRRKANWIGHILRMNCLPTTFY